MARALWRGAARPSADAAQLQSREYRSWIGARNGDMRDQDSMAAPERCPLPLHVAADYRLWARDSAETSATILLGARATMRAALEAGVERVFYTSSVAALQPGHREAVEMKPSATHHEASSAPTSASELMDEREVEDYLIAQENLPRRDRRTLHPDRAARHQAHAHRPHHRRSRNQAHAGLCRYRLSLVHVDDVAKDISSALERGTIGENYILSSTDVSLEDHAGRHRRTDQPQERRKWNLPRGAFVSSGLWRRTMARVTGKDPS